MYKEIVTPNDFVSDKIDIVDGISKREAILSHIELHFSDKEILEITEEWKTLAEANRLKAASRKKDNLLMYYGKDFDKLSFADRVGVGQSSINHLRHCFDLFVTRNTSKIVKPIVFSNQKTQESKELAKLNGKALKAIADKQDLQLLSQQVLREQQFSGIGIQKYGYEEGEYKVELIPTEKVWIDPNAKTAEDAEFIIEEQEVTAMTLVRAYPKLKEQINKFTEGKLFTRIKIEEIHTGELVFVIWREKELVIAKDKNPNFDDEGVEIGDNDVFGIYLLGDYRYNYFRKPTVPYVFFTLDNDQTIVYDGTTLFEEAAKVQLKLNTLEDTVEDNLTKEGRSFNILRGFSEEEQEAFADRDGSDDVCLSDNQTIEHIGGTFYPSHLHNKADIYKLAIENVFGTHDVSQGISTPGDSGVKVDILRTNDEQKSAGTGRAIERNSLNLYKTMQHIMLVFFKEPQLLADLSKEGAEKFFEFSRNNITDGAEIRIVVGHDNADDKVAKTANAKDLLMQGVITKRKYYEIDPLFDDSETAYEDYLEEMAIEKFIEEQGAALIQQAKAEGKSLNEYIKELVKKPSKEEMEQIAEEKKQQELTPTPIVEPNAEQTPIPSEQTIPQQAL